MPLTPLHDPALWWEWFVNLFFTLVAAFGGFVGYITRTLAKGEPVVILRACVEALGSAFVGFVALLICRAMNLDGNWTGAIVGLLGWMGSGTSVALLERVVRRKLGIDDAPTNDATQN